jgi:hypothetical protein
VKPTQALRTLAGAIDAGQLPDDTTLRLSGRVVEVDLPNTFYRRSFEDHERWAEQVRMMFPGGTNRRMGTQHRGDKRRRILASDRADYRVKIGNHVLIVVEYVIPHEHQSYRGELNNGKPKWICIGCRQPITITEARRLGLLPPRATKAAAK